METNTSVNKLSPKNSVKLREIVNILNRIEDDNWDML
jgi:hypothetical protein